MQPDGNGCALPLVHTLLTSVMPSLTLQEVIKPTTFVDPKGLEAFMVCRLIA